MDRLYINNREVDLSEGVGIYLTYRSNILGDIKKIFGNNSSTIKIPATETNASIIEYSHMLSSQGTFPYRIHYADLYRDGILLIKGATVNLLSATSEVFEMSLVWGASEQVKALGEKSKLAELADKSKDTDVQWMYNAVGTEMFPEAVYGFIRSRNNGKYSLHPVLSVTDILRRVEEKFGVSFKFYNQDIYDTLKDVVVPILKSETPQEVITLSKTEGSINPPWTSITHNTWVEGGGNGTILVNYDDTKLIGIVLEYNLEAWAPYSVNQADRVSLWYDALYLAVIKVTPQEKDDGTVEYDDTEIMEIPVSYIGEGELRRESDNEDFWWYPVTLSVEKYDDLETFNAEERIRFELRMKPLTDSINESQISSFNILPGTATLTFKKSAIQLGEYYHLWRNLPDMEIIKFLKGIMQMFGLFAYEDNRGNIVMMDYPSFFVNKKQAQDWSEHLVITDSRLCESQEYGDSNFGQTNILTYKDDDLNTNMNGSFPVDNTTLDAEVAYVDLPFSAVRSIGGDALEQKGIAQMAVIPMYKQINDDPEEWQPETERDGDGEKNAYALYRRAYNEKNGRREYYLSCEGLDWTTLLKQYYQGIIASVQKARYIEETFYMDAMTLRKVDLGMPVYLRQYASYFAIIEIKTKKNDLAEIKLLKII